MTLKNVSMTAENDHFRKTIFGDMEFLKGCITGPIVLSMSSLINREADVTLNLDFKPALDENKLDNRLLREIQGNPNRDIRYLLTTLLPREIIEFFIENTDSFHFAWPVFYFISSCHFFIYFRSPTLEKFH